MQARKTPDLAPEYIVSKITVNKSGHHGTKAWASPVVMQHAGKGTAGKQSLQR